MKLALAVLAICVVGAFAAPRLLQEEEYQFLFRRYITQFGKNYHADEFFGRYNTFRNNVDHIKSHNDAKKSWTLAVNEFADMSTEEFRSNKLGYKMINQAYLRSLNEVAPSNITNLATSVDWRAKNAVTAVKDQGQCGSCWAFSTTGSLEGLWAIKTGSIVSLSEQQLVDCSASYGNEGCNGGWMDQGFQYAMDKGLCTEASYPYQAVDGTCKTCSAALPAGFVTKFVDVPANNEQALAAALNTQPVSVAIEADQSAFQFYSSGVFSDANACGTQLDHGVLAVGYNSDAATPYYIIKNSWGSSWGSSGYILLSMNNNMCGISQAASYPSA